MDSMTPAAAVITLNKCGAIERKRKEKRYN